MSNKKVILIDVDGTVIPDMLDEWLRRYNRDWDDNLLSKNITAWDLRKFVKPDCGNHIFDYLSDADFYDNFIIPTDVRFAIIALQSIPSFQVVFLTAGIHIGKYNLLKKYGLLKSEKEIIYATDKSLVFGDAMIDDYEENLKAFKSRNPSGLAVLIDAPYNREFIFKLEHYRYSNWVDITKLVIGKLL